MLAGSVCLSAREALASNPLKIAVLFSKSTGEEFQCVAKAMQIEADKTKIAVKIELIDFDNTISTLVKKSKNIVKNGFDIVVGPRTSQEALATKALFSNAGIPQVLPVASHPDLYSKDGLQITMVPSALRYSDLAAKLVSKKLRSKMVLIVVNDSLPSSVVYASLFPIALKKHGFKGRIETVRSIDGYPKYDQIAARVRTLGADLVYAPLYGIDIAGIYSELSKAEVTTILLAGAGIFELRDFIKQPNPKNVQLLLNAIWDGRIRGQYASNFQHLINNSCQGFGAGLRIPAIYDAFRLILEVTKSNPHARGRDLGMLLQRHKFSGILGKRSFDKKGELLLPMPIFEVKNNRFRLFDVVH